MTTRQSPGVSLPSVSDVRETVREHWFAYLLVVPTVLYLMILVWYPYGLGFYMSTFDWPLFGEKSFIGLGNYQFMLEWDIFWLSLRATLLYGLQTVGHIFFGTLMALIVWKQEKFKRITSLLFLVPILLPPLVTGTIFRHVLHPSVGPFFKVLVSAGILQEPIYWMTTGWQALTAITLIGVWTWSSFVFLLVYASLEGIPQTYYESSMIYGANVWQRFRYITFPQIKTALLIALILRIIRNLGKVSQPLQVTRGGPGWSTSVIGILLYRLAWSRQEFGLAFAAGVIMGLISLIFVVGFLVMFERESGEVQTA
jgi:ABC-type sugar transport system permease subunit